MSNVLSIADHLRAKSRDGHEALMRALGRPLPAAAIKGDTSGMADWILAGLWSEGYQITPVPKEPSNAG